MVPWDYQIEDENYQKEPWILKKGKEYVTIQKDNHNKFVVITTKTFTRFSEPQTALSQGTGDLS